MESECATFYFIYKYLSTLEHMFRIARCLTYWSLWYDDMRLCKFLIQSLGSFYFENTKQGDSCAQFAIYPFQSLYIIYIQVQTYSYLSHSELVQTPCLWSQLWLLIVVGYTHTRSSLQSPLSGCIKLFIPLKIKRKETYERHSCWFK